MTRYFASVLVAIAIAVPNSSGAADKGHYIAIGVGGNSCGSWTEARREKSWRAEVYIGWVQGYFTSYNAWSDKGEADILKDTDMLGVEASIDNFCTAHPLKSISDATENVLGEIYNDRIQKILDDTTAAAAKEKAHK